MANFACPSKSKKLVNLRPSLIPEFGNPELKSESTARLLRRELGWFVRIGISAFALRTFYVVTPQNRTDAVNVLRQYS